MTEKELSYVEDAIGHEKNIIKICNETYNYLQDDALKTFIQEEITKHTKRENSLLNLLEAKVNE